MGQPSKYPPELRRRAITEAIERGRKIPEVASEVGLGITRDVGTEVVNIDLASPVADWIVDPPMIVALDEPERRC